MQIAFLGAARNVTGSMFLLTVNGSRILLECGLFQGPRQEAFERNRHLPFDAAKVDAMVLSHAHIDHSGNIPNLVRAGFRGNIMTFVPGPVTFGCRPVHHGVDVAYLTERARRGAALEPIYTPPTPPAA